MSASVVAFPPECRIQLTDAQKSAHEAIMAFATGLGGGMFTLEGYAGTGKTTIIAQIVTALAANYRIGIAAPTNKAVGVLESKIPASTAAQCRFGSLQSFLGLKVIENEDGTTICRPDGRPKLGSIDILIVDECSMVGNDLFARLALNAHSLRVLFVGDPAQLAPVNDGDISPTFHRVRRRERLTEIVRQASENPIIALSMRIRAAIESGETLTAHALAAAIPAGARSLCIGSGGHATAVAWALYDLREGRDSRVICYTNAAVMAANREIHTALHGDSEPFAVGEPVIVNSDHELDDSGRLYNSEEMTVAAVTRDAHPRYPHIDARLLLLRRDDGAEVAVWVTADEGQAKREVSAMFAAWRNAKTAAANLPASTPADERAKAQDRVRDLSAAAWEFKKAFAPIRHRYAITAHKSQGSTFHTAIIHLADLAKNSDPVEHARMLYVAATRPTHNLALVA